LSEDFPALAGFRAGSLLAGYRLEAQIESELLDEIVSAKPKTDHTRYRWAEELRDNGLRPLRDAMALLESKATAGERDDYRRFVLTLAGKVAAAHREHGPSVSPAEAEAIQQITAALGTTGS
jgi:hypothetical protein